jgi:outer membrane protein TolC
MKMKWTAMLLAQFFLLVFTWHKAKAQHSTSLTLPQALQIVLAKQEILKAKTFYAQSAAQGITTAKRDGLPDFSLSIQQSYGTSNGLNGLTSGLPGETTITSGPVSGSQNWNAAFASYYTSNINWNLFSFGLQRAHVADARGAYQREQADLDNEKFQQQIRVAGAYLSLLSAQRLHYSLKVNLYRVTRLRDVILQRTKFGLNPGVDSSIVNSELSKARIAIFDAINYEQSQEAALAMQLGITNQHFVLDSSFVAGIPADLSGATTAGISGNPQLAYLATRVASNKLSTNFLSRSKFPRIIFFGTIQGRGSGFGTGYSASNLNDFSDSYLHGINPVRVNYLVGIGVSWSLTNLSRVSAQIKSQELNTQGLASEYRYQETNLVNQLEQGRKQLINTLDKYRQTPLQLKAANDAYAQKKMLYMNGLTNIVDVTQTLYNLNRAETDRDIASNAVWQSLLFISASSGDLKLFLNQVK